MILTANGDNTPSCIDGETDDDEESPFSLENQTAPGFEPWGNEAPAGENPQEEPTEETEEPNEIPEDAKEGDSVPLINIPGESSEEREKREKEKLKAEKRQKKEEKKNRKKMSKMQRWLDGAGNTISSIFDKAYEAGTGDNENTEEYGR
jgi:outer membrane biosynthesis protein TonB